MSQLFIYTCDWCGKVHESKGSGTPFGDARIEFLVKSQLRYKSSSHTLLLGDICDVCRDKMRDRLDKVIVDLSKEIGKERTP